MTGLKFAVEPSSYHEDNSLSLPPAELVTHLALAKARDVASTHSDAVVIGADTLVFADGHVLGKPTDQADARRMITLLNGKTHTVNTGVAVVAAGREFTDVSETLVTFRSLSKAEIEHYVALPDLYDLAGAYAVQGTAALFTARIEGDYLGVVGLPLSLLCPMLSKVGVDLL